MNKLFKILLLVVLTSIALLSTSCWNRKDAPEPPASIVEIKELNATAWDRWVYFSFATGKTVTVDNPEKSTEWDIAFHRNEFRINGAQHYTGKGGVHKSSSSDFSAAITPSSLSFMGNIEAMVEISGGMGAPKKSEKQYFVSTSPEGGDKNDMRLFLRDMSKMMDGAAAMYPIVKEVFVFRAADGKSYYKLQMTASVNGEGKNGGTLSFKYQKI